MATIKVNSKANIIVLGSVLMGALIVFSAGIFQVMKLKREIKMLRKENPIILERTEGFQMLF
jgi:putative membrane protein